MHPISICSYALYACIIWLITYYDLPWEWLAILSVLMLADTILWVGKSYVLWADSTWFSSHKMKVWIMSKMAILIAATLAWISISYITKSQEISWMLADIFVWLLVAAELVSIIQNSIMMHTGKQVEEWDAISLVLTWLLKQIKDFLSDKMEH